MIVALGVASVSSISRHACLCMQVPVRSSIQVQDASLNRLSSSPSLNESCSAADSPGGQLEAR